ncbi:MAG: histidine kinase [Clostridiales bacterium]|nr:histidine kinase [Clostridiales bacterium]
MFVSSVKLYIPSLQFVFRDSHGSIGNFYREPAEDIINYASTFTFGKLSVEDSQSVVAYPFKVSDKLVFLACIYLDVDALEDELVYAVSNYDSSYTVRLNDATVLFSNIGKDDVFSSGYLQFSKFSPQSGISIDLFVRKTEVLRDYWLFIYLMIAMAALFIVSFAVFAFTTSRLVRRPLDGLIGGFKRMENGEIPVKLDFKGSSDLAYIYKAFNDMNEKLHVLVGLTYEQKLLIQKAELKQLQAQINPHFLYNTFFMLNTFIKSFENEKALNLSLELGKYFQYITRSSSPNATLKEENNHARIYADIQAERYEGRISIQYDDLPIDMESLTVPRLIMQPLIENTFKHALADVTENGLLKVSFASDEAGHHIVIEDNSNVLSDSDIADMNDRLQNVAENSEVTGCINIDRRLKMLYPAPSGLYFTRSPLGGLKAEILICMNGAENV